MDFALQAQTITCGARDCNIRLLDRCDHRLCRSHAKCSVEVEGVKVWHPVNCVPCQMLQDVLRDEDVSIFLGLE